MKKIYVLFILLTSMMQAQVDIQNFKVTSPTNETFTWNDGQRFKYKFDIRGNYGYNEIKLKVYAQSVTSNNLIGLIRWNREGDDNLSFNSYTTKSMWVSIANNWNGRSFNTNPTKKFYLVAEYQGNSRTYTYTIPDGDNDGDGVTNTQDECPNEAGPASNNGCPLPPDLITANLTIKTKTSTGGSITYNYDHITYTPSLYYNKSAEFSVKVKNKGAGKTNRSCELHVVIAANKNSYPVWDPGEAQPYVYRDFTVPVLESGEEKTFKFTEYLADYMGSVPLYDEVTYYIFFHIDWREVTNEPPSAFSNNINRYAFKYIKDKSSGGIGIIVPIDSDFDSKSSISNKSYNLAIFNLQGILVKQKTVTDEQEEQKLIEELPKGFYIIKNDQRTYKVGK
ncbi:T9SS type A sorting domain-containing protein [Aquimarina litoralis]